MKRTREYFRRHFFVGLAKPDRQTPFKLFCSRLSSIDMEFMLFIFHNFSFLYCMGIFHLMKFKICPLWEYSVPCCQISIRESLTGFARLLVVNNFIECWKWKIKCGLPLNYPSRFYWQWKAIFLLIFMNRGISREREDNTVRPKRYWSSNLGKTSTIWSKKY